MSLALVQVPVADFDDIYHHLISHKPHLRNYRNMHLRATCQRNGGRDLRHLHGMFATSVNEIEGMISGPNVFWHYKLNSTGKQTQMRLLSYSGSQKEDIRLGKRFLRDVLTRMRAEQEGPQEHHPKLKEGQFYLRRSAQGMPVEHSNCQTAIAWEYSTRGSSHSSRRGT